MRSARLKPKMSRKRLWLTVALSLIGSLFLGAFGYAGYLYFKADQAIKSVSGGDKLPEPQPLAATKKKEDPITFLVAGIDSRAGSGGTLNTDVLILASLNPETKSATMVSIPRDMQLKPKGLPARKANYYYAMFYNENKDTALYETKKMFQELFQFPIDYAVTINFDGFREIVDELGGLDINVDMDMKYVDTADGTNIDLRKGYQHLNGKQVLDFVRYRHSNRGTAESSDTERNERQQQVLKAILGKLTSFGGIAQWGGVLEIAGRTVKTDIPESTLRSWILSFSKMKPDTIESISLGGRWESPYMIVEEEVLDEALKALRRRAELPEQPAKPLDLTTVALLDPREKPSGAKPGGTTTLDGGGSKASPKPTAKPSATPKGTAKPSAQPPAKPTTAPEPSAEPKPSAAPGGAGTAKPGASSGPVETAAPDVTAEPTPVPEAKPTAAPQEPTPAAQPSAGGPSPKPSGGETDGPSPSAAKPAPSEKQGGV
ncbi:LCP family protein [Paenibacillus thermoaerophilus]|uniref:LCP family protein n=1 Tax=Paenibacillus thermoaerophilus TaxID=1215385 RepID=A0ABW2UX11_9BACL|nr:LCP family protein [Paenibacillus thermoaerophilus]